MSSQNSKPSGWMMFFSVSLVLVITGVLIWGLFSLPKELTATLITASAGLCAVLISKSYERRQIILQEHRAAQLPVYKDFLEFIFRVFKNRGPDGGEWTEEQMNLKLIETAEHMLLFASDNVIKSYSLFRRAFLENEDAPGQIGDHRPGFTAFGNLLLAIRQDLGHKNDGLGLLEVYIMFINDPEFLLAATPEQLRAAAEAEQVQNDG